MTIKVGDKMPAGKFTTMSKDGPKKVSTEELFDGKTVVLFSVPGPLRQPAMRSTCLVSSSWRTTQEKGVDTIGHPPPPYTAVNDVFVMNGLGQTRRGR